MKFKKNSDEIINGLYKSGLILIISHIIIFLTLNANTTIEIGHYICIALFVLGNIVKAVSLIYLFYYICSALYKILNKLEKK